MYNTARLYDLSFVSSKKKNGAKGSTKPQIVFSINTEHADEVNRRLWILVQRNSANARAYLGEEKEFSLITPDLFGRAEFGYGKCGIFSYENMDLKLHIELCSGRELLYATLTIHLLVQALASSIADGERRNNQAQQLDLETSCNSRVPVYGHAVAGYASSRLISWIQGKTKDLPAEQNYAAVPKEVTSAMSDAWRAIVKEEFKKWTSECKGQLSKDGRFLLECFGNACDIAIYPDSMWGGMEHGVRFSCHNLDAPIQQITLIAGLAKLCEIARRDE